MCVLNPVEALELRGIGENRESRVEPSRAAVLHWLITA